MNFSNAPLVFIFYNFALFLVKSVILLGVFFFRSAYLKNKKKSNTIKGNHHNICVPLSSNRKSWLIHQVSIETKSNTETISQREREKKRQKFISFKETSQKFSLVYSTFNSRVLGWGTLHSDIQVTNIWRLHSYRFF